MQRRGHLLDDLGEEPVELRRGDALLVFLRDGIDEIEQAIHAIAALRGEHRDRCPGQEVERVVGELAERGLRRVAGDLVGLVERDHERAAGLLDHARDPRVLLGGTELGIDHEHHHVGASDLPDRHRHGDLLDLLVDLRLAADARGVDQRVVATADRERRVDGIHGRPRDVVDERALLAEQAVRQRGLAGVRAADERDAQRAHGLLVDGLLALGELGVRGLGIVVAEHVEDVVTIVAGRRVVVVIGSGGLGGDRLHDRLEQAIDAAAVRGRDRVGLAEAERVELVDEILTHHVIDLVDREEHGLAGDAELVREAVIDRGQTGAPIDDQQQRIRLADRT